MLLINKARYKARDCNVKLLIVDSVINLFKKEYIGLRNLVDRQQKLHIHIRDLMKFADRHNSSIFITNHYVNGKPAGGQNLAHSASYRLYIRKSRGRRNENRRIIRLVDSPNLPEAEVIIKITGEGLSDT